MRISGVAARRMALFCLLALVLLCLGGCGQQATPVDKVSVVADVKPDGSLFVRETVTYGLEPGVRSVSHTLEAPEGARIADVSVSVTLANGRRVSFTQSAGAAQETAGTFSLQSIDDARLLLTSTHPFPEAGGETTFVYQYTVQGAARRYADGGTVTWSALGKSGWDVPIRQWSLRLQLPIGSAEDRLDAALPEAPSGTSLTRSSDGRSLLAAAENLSAHTRIVLRVDMDSAPLVHTPIQSGTTLAEVRAAEQAAHAYTSGLALFWILGCVAAYLAGAVWLALSIRKRRKAPEKAPPRDPAMGIPAPAELSAMMPLSLGARRRDLIAMVLDLIQRGHLGFIAPPAGQPLTRETLDQARIARRSTARDMLMDGEFFLIHWFIDALGDGTDVTLGQLRHTPKQRFRADFRVWRRLVNAQIAKRAWFVKPYPLRTTLLAAGAVMLGGTLLVASLGAASDVWWMLPPAIVLTAIALRMRKLSAPAVAEVRQWRALHAQILGGAPVAVQSIGQWERILLYAQAMGSGAQAMGALQRSLNASNPDAPWPDAGEATFLAWPLLEYNRQLTRWFSLFCNGILP